MKFGSTKIGRRTLAIAGLTVLACGLPHGAQAAPGRALRFVNGHIYTPQGWRSTMEVRGERIVRIGTRAQARKWARAAVQIVDLKGRTVFPGLYDMHVHPVLQAKGDEGRCRIPQDAGPQRLLELVAACTKAAKAGEWVSGGQWQASLMAGTPITAATLDAVSPDNPVMLFDVSGHSVWANSRALALAEITAATPNPEGGIIERDEKGNPTGILRETAGRLISIKVPAQPLAETERQLAGHLAMLAGFGVVGYVEAMAYRDDLEVYAALADKGVLRQHVQACIAYSESGRPNPAFDQTLADRAKFARATFNANCVKVFADGVPTESHTGAMLADYQAGQPNAPARGLLLFDPAAMAKDVARWDKLGVTVLFHAAGDRAVRASLDAIEAARKANGTGGPLHQVGHSTFVDPADLPRFKALRAAVEFSPYLWDPQPINDDITAAVGSPRMDRVWPIREGFAAGALVVAGSDWAVVPSPNPWIGIETAITRRNPGGSARSYGLAEAVTLPQAITMFTINAARRMGIADKAGSLEAGKQADFLVLDRDPFAVPVTDIHRTAVLETWVGGKRIFARAKD
ncbi:amidohydrolase family protein [Novosphingobium sp.]|uniref:amidohydrolase n=1 Tax=Novosphingobium sp. TaxID=1874826 RepID=UPI00262C2DC8|nr:amidohydrolase family protein [Novosphingobium sp.]